MTERNTSLPVLHVRDPVTGLERIRDQVFMRETDALGFIRRSAGVEDRGQIVGIHCDMGRIP